MKKILNVPFVSQYEVGRDPDGLGRACGMACIKMMIDYSQREKMTLQGLLDEAKLIVGGYIDKVGWSHMGLTATLRNHGLGAYSEEFRSVLNDVINKKILPSSFEKEHIERGIKKISGEIEDGRPVMVSGIKNWTEKDLPHTFLIVGVEKDSDVSGFYYHDPDDEKKDGKNNFIDIDTFRKNWRKFAIFTD